MSNTQLFINGTKVTATHFAWDGCHKIYLVNDMQEAAEMSDMGYELFPIDELEDAYDNSCGLRFIQKAHNYESIVEQFEDATFSYGETK